MKKVRSNLAHCAGSELVDDIRLRPGFIRRLTALTEDLDYDPATLVDRPKPVLPRQPPLAALAALTKGIALQLCITLIFLAQTQPRKTLGKGALLKIKIDGSDTDPIGLVDLLAVPGSHNPSEESTYNSNSRENRKRQIRSGFIQLDRLGLAELPTGGRKGAPRFNTVHLNEDARPTAAGAKRYTPPRSTARVVTIPPEFFLNGWVHALSKSEIAMWLMLRDLSQRPDASLPPDKLHIRGRNRLLQYDLSRAVWDTHARLEEFGLIVVHKDPNRRPNGTTIDGDRAQPHFFELRDAGLRQNGLSTVLSNLADLQARKSA
ncbi:MULTISPECIES: hypothetical protein [Mycobacterium]|uniref:Uncharacterized protein n=1 Tax=Mycobacterium kyorinense TaxID=487514 RepID=A0A1X1XWW2_9MYCO|nr:MULTISPECIES: hypothetical protein [Mycobacterium]ORW03343.1 hypothetical protein AWC14_05205 [Mycobacterium kyorinense]PBJ66896.1 hypothetical protein BB737_05165 [Mycobacterium avium subsp. hominissuis]